MKRNQCELILREAQTWQSEGIIDATALAQLEARYAPFLQGRATPLRNIILLSMGALLISLGIVSLLAANWDQLSRPMRTAIAFTPLLLSIGAWLYGRVNNISTRAYQEPLGIFWTLSIGSGIAIISQTYQISGSVDNFVMTWALLTLPILYSTLAATPTVSYFALLFSWVCISAQRGTNSQLYWLLILLAIPAIRTIRAHAPHGPRLALSLWPSALLSVAALGFTLEKALPGLWTIIYASAFAVLYFGGLLLEERNASQWNAPMHTLGLSGLAVLLYLLTFQWPWKKIGWGCWRSDRITSPWQMTFDFALTLLLPLIVILLGIMIFRKWRQQNPHPTLTTLKLNQSLWGASPLPVAIVYALTSNSATQMAPSLIMTAWLALLALTTLAAGLAQQQLRTINGGVLLFLSIVLGKFFTDEYSFTARGLALLLCGALFFTINWFASRRLRNPL